MSPPGGSSGSRAQTHPPFGQRRSAPARTWWGKAWGRAVEESAYSDDDLKAGRAMARTASVGGISLAPGQAVAAVSDSGGLWSVGLALPTFEAAALDAVVEVVAAESGRIGALLSHQLPHSLVEHAEEAGAELPPSGGELVATCSCDAWVDPCPHALAVLTQLTWLVDADPLALFLLRGLARDDLLARLHAREPDPDPSLVSSARATEATPSDPDVLLDLALDAAHRARQLLEALDEGSVDEGSVDQRR